MRARFVVVALLVAVGLGCGGLGQRGDDSGASPEEEVSPDQLGDDIDVVEPPPEVPAPRIPPAFGDVPGWLGLVASASPQIGFTPRTEAAALVVPWPDPLAEVAEGTRLVALDTKGARADVSLLGVREIPYGCDDNPTRMALFSSPDRLAEGPVWLLPPDTPDVVVRPLDSVGEATAVARAWEAGDLRFDLRLSDMEHGSLDVSRDGPRGAVPFEIQRMDGDDEPTSLENEHQVGAPAPVMVLRMGSESVVVTRTWSYEGVHFRVYTVASTMKEAGGDSLYLCAF